MADRWEEEGFEAEAREWLTALIRDRKQATSESTVRSLASQFRRFARLGESSGREAERAECAAVADAEAAAYEQSVRDMDSAGQGALATAETRAVLACRRVAQAIRVGARPGGTNGR